LSETKDALNLTIFDIYIACFLIGKIGKYKVELTCLK